ncbi:cytosolic phospholipase A2-like [Mercenaria mercenaria]|uniref:cytosolic phospholipase A2-like n=1 Tax=Mercenaria mercenaria TaxID=6596 RepID=UPI00234E4D46|nr:cytosolic phospholipase A2-like [Mercenaria mercenaria]
MLRREVNPTSLPEFCTSTKPVHRQVEPSSCLIFSVTIVKGYNITKGYNLWPSLFRKSDPSIKLTIGKALNGTQRTKHFNIGANPEWNKTFDFFLDPSADHELEISLRVPNFLSGETISKKKIKISKESKERFHEKIQFSKESAVDIEMSSKPSNNLKQRYSDALCDDEKRFIEERRKCVFQAMQDILGDEAPRTIKEVPTIGVLGSGGGFRALTASSGVMGALVESRISDMVIYNAGLSGSAWYLSTLYSHPDWPQKSPRELRNELRDSIGYSLFWKLNPFGLWRYWKRVNAKRDQGQPVSLTDYYGLFIGETLLQGVIYSLVYIKYIYRMAEAL